MKYNPEYHHRRSIRLKEYDYTNPNWYYITICTHNKKCFFGEIKEEKMLLNNPGKIVEEEWLKTREIREYIDLDNYVIMPNHFHGIIIESSVGATRWVAPQAPQAPTALKATTLQPCSLAAIIGQFKSKVTKRIKQIGIHNFKWQRNYYEHIIRNEEDLFRIRKYIELNPLKWKSDKYYL